MNKINPIKLVSLNIWGGNLEEKIVKFFEKNKDADFYCIQEVYNNASMKMSTDEKQPSLNIFNKIQNVLPDHIGYFHSIYEIKGYGIAIFVKRKIKVLEPGSINVYHNKNYPGSGPSHSRDLQWVKCEVDGKKFYILNFHGLWNGLGKSDSKDRITQSKKIKMFISSLKDPTILCGDFNLRPDSESIRIVSKNMKDLIQMYNVKSTRTSFYAKEEKFADYVFVSKDIQIKDFVVWQDEVSDHSPLFLEFVI